MLLQRDCLCGHRIEQYNSIANRYDGLQMKVIIPANNYSGHNSKTKISDATLFTDLQKSKWH